MESDGESTELVTVESGALIEARRGGGTVVPAIVAAAGDGAARRFLEFFAVTIDNPNTRAAYFHACRRFFAWCDRREDIDELMTLPSGLEQSSPTSRHQRSAECGRPSHR